MKEKKSKRTYTLVFIPNHDDALQRAKALDFGKKLEVQFGYTTVTKKNPLDNKQFVVYMNVAFKDIHPIVAFMKSKNFGEDVAKSWWLNAVQTQGCLITGVNSGNCPIEDWINELPR